VQKLKLHWPVIRSLFLSPLWVIFITLLAVAQSTHAQAVKILPLGDSWTEGVRHHVSYRYDLWFKLIDAGFDVDFVGSKRNTFDGPDLDLYPEYLTTFDRNHQATAGIRSDELVGSAKQDSAKYQPDIVLLWAGGADLGWLGASGVINAKFGLRDIIEGIRSVVPGVTILLAQSPPYIGDGSDFVELLNDAVATVASDLDTPQSPVILVDHYTGYDIGSMTMGDRDHQNRVGEAWIAENWFEVLADILPDFKSEPFQINAGHAGAWFNPETPGQGQLVDVEPASKLLFLSWFTFADAASADPNEQHWFTAQGNYSGDSADLVVYETLGGRFDDPQEVSTDAVGQATLSFSDCANGQLDYTIDTWDLQGSFPLQRAIPGTENVCEERTGLATEPLEPNDGRDGAWFDQATPGQGFLIDAHPDPEGDDFIFVAWFTYGENTVSGQRWLTAQGPLQGSTADLVVYETLGGSFDDPEPSESNAVGTMNIDFTDCSNALLSYSITDETLAGMIDIERVIPGTEALCEELTRE
jgi:acyl-CoA thioesterase-1